MIAKTSSVASNGRSGWYGCSGEEQCSSHAGIIALVAVPTVQGTVERPREWTAAMLGFEDVDGSVVGERSRTISTLPCQAAKWRPIWPFSNTASDGQPAERSRRTARALLRNATPIMRRAALLESF